ncbi:MAG: hypothetical protein B7X58_08315 [Marinobacter sp. 34-60-7]|nr:MAG: hypothetical protein B7X58_08315 [Marinobacter sp. 34-60-7]
MRASIVAIVCGVSSSGVLAQASVSNVTIDGYGQINHGVMVSDTAAGTKTYTADNDNSATRAGFHVKADIEGTGLSVGSHVELEYQVNPSNVVNEDRRTVSGEFTERHLNIFVAGAFGKVSVGQGDGAANGNIEQDLSGTAVISYANPALIGAGLNFVDESNGASQSFGSVMSNNDFESRYTRVRYDLPKFGPVQLAVSQGTKTSSDVDVITDLVTGEVSSSTSYDSRDITELSARFSGELGGGKMIGALGYSSADIGGAADKLDTIGGSVSWLHGSGVNLTAGYSQVEDDNAANPDSDFYLVKVGYKTGKHAMDIHMMESNDRVLEGDSATTVGVGYVYSPVSYFSAYAGYNNNTLDRDAGDYEDVNTLFVGGLLKF